MKLKTTKSAIKNGFNTIISIDYCSAQYLLSYKNPFAYSAGVYGWSCDYYQIGSKCISTGYQPIGQNLDYKILDKFEKKAEKVVCNNTLEYADKMQKVDDLLNELFG